jgi:hypothetical protein
MSVRTFTLLLSCMNVCNLSNIVNKYNHDQCTSSNILMIIITENMFCYRSHNVIKMPFL